MTLGWRWPGAASAMPGRSSFGLSLLVQLAVSQLRASVLFGMILSLGHSVCFFCSCSRYSLVGDTFWLAVARRIKGLCKWSYRCAYGQTSPIPLSFKQCYDAPHSESRHRSVFMCVFSCRANRTPQSGTVLIVHKLVRTCFPGRKITEPPGRAGVAVQGSGLHLFRSGFGLWS